jgi:hypothetical protein
MPFPPSEITPYQLTVGPLLKLYLCEDGDWEDEDESYDRATQPSRFLGYTVKFYQEDLSPTPNSWYLYLDPTGCHCVLEDDPDEPPKITNPTDDWHVNLTSLEQQLGVMCLRIPSLDPVEVASFTFEDFLAKLYFGIWIFNTFFDEDSYFEEVENKFGDAVVHSRPAAEKLCSAEDLQSAGGRPSKVTS